MRRRRRMTFMKCRRSRSLSVWLPDYLKPCTSSWYYYLCYAICSRGGVKLFPQLIDYYTPSNSPADFTAWLFLSLLRGRAGGWMASFYLVFMAKRNKIGTIKVLPDDGLKWFFIPSYLFNLCFERKFLKRRRVLKFS